MPQTFYTPGTAFPSPFSYYDQSPSQIAAFSGNPSAQTPALTGVTPAAAQFDWGNALNAGNNNGLSGINLSGGTGQVNNLAELRTFGLAGSSGTKLNSDPGTGGNSTGMASMFDWSKLGLGAAVSMANLYNSWQAGKLAKQQYEYSKGLSDTNLYNSATNYNASLESQAKSAGIMNGTSDADVAARVAKYSAKTTI